MDDHSHEVAAAATTDTSSQVPIAPVMFWIGWIAPIVPLMLWRVLSGRTIEAGGIFILWMARMVEAVLVTACAAIAIAKENGDVRVGAELATVHEIAVAVMAAVATYRSGPL